MRHGTGSYVFNTVVDVDASVNSDGRSEMSESHKSGQNSLKIGRYSEDSAAGLFVSNSFICGAVARALRGPMHNCVLPIAFIDFFRAFWGQQQLLAEDGVQLPGHVTKFLPVLDTTDLPFGCVSMWTLAFDGGAPAACNAAAAAIARAPFCGRYIQEVVQIPVCFVASGLIAALTGHRPRAEFAVHCHCGDGSVCERPTFVLPRNEGCV